MHESIQEVRAFTKMLAEEKLINEAKAKKESWAKYAALSMAFIAIVAGYTMGKGGSCSGRVSKDLSEATYNQTHASDQWSFFQSKAQKQLIQELEIQVRAAVNSNDTARLEKLEANIKRYDTEKAEIKAKAEAFERKRDEFRADAEAQTRLGAKFGQAAQIFQIALAIGGLCLLSKRKWMWYITLAVAAFAAYRLALALLA